MDKTATDRAYDMGRNHGLNVGSWVVDGNTSEDTCRRISQGWDDGDPEIMDMCPSPLSGEWAGEPTPDDIVEMFCKGAVDWSQDGIQEIVELHAEILSSYEEGFSDGYWSQVLTSCLAMMRKVSER
jgi:hypothetical protein